ncbi:hypothetical protein [Kitasatospora phosalacinea]|uniref:Knr4/Smi1-like domain-containing protein n=1 Tax=Kitasatospora phosalacinea TaxID=2065 RepID=A0A9W6PGK7_9ACTN|nr:hypothetical protein [Kitasatospora phosalacinea]GLW54502.1 hypothetical protein Kpho01_25130 [Kitasatospora phosalacinea]
MTPAVAELAALTRWTRRRATATDWLPVERRLGLPVPASFKELAETFGPGEFSRYLLVHGPGDERTPHSLARARAAWFSPAAADLLHPYPPPGEPGGPVPWGGTCHGDTFFWLPGAARPDTWPVLALSETADWHRFDLTVPEFVLEAIRPDGTVAPFAVGDLVPPSFLPAAP